MNRYLIKVTSTGTQSNPNFAGVVNHYWLGKSSYTTVGRIVIENDCSNLDSAIRFLAKEYGYSSEAAAKRGLSFVKKNHDEETSKYNHHTFEHEIILVEFPQ